MRVLNIAGNVSENASRQTAERLERYFPNSQIECALFGRPNSKFEQVTSEKGINTRYFGPSVTDRFDKISLLPGKGYFKAIFDSMHNTSDYDIIHIYGGPLVHGPIGLLYAMCRDSQLITRFNGYIPIPESKVKSTLVKSIISYVLRNAVVVFNSKKQKEDILSAYDVEDSDHIKVIPPGVDQDHFKPSQETRTLVNTLGIDPSTSIIGSVMTPRPVKRLDRAFEILSSLSNERDIIYIIVGESDHISDYQDLAKKKGVSDLIHWVGHKDQEDLAQYYSLFDVTIMTSEWESFGMSITESYLCGTPCVAFDVGGMSDQIIDGETGYLAEPYNIEEFTDKVNNLLSNPDLATEFGYDGKEYVSDEFTLEKASEKYKSMLSEILD